MVLMSSMLSLMALAQNNNWIKRISETEVSESYSTTTNDGKESNILNTIEDCIKEFLLTTNNNMDEFHVVINNIEKGTLKAYLDTRKDKGLISPEEIHNIDYIEYMIKVKFSFVSNGKIYILTYEPINLDKKTVTDGLVIFDTKSGDTEGAVQVSHKNIYLYRRDDDGWKKASDLIREDNYVKGKFSMELYPYTSFMFENKNPETWQYEGIAGWSVNKITNGSVFMTFSTITWTPQAESHSYNSILVFVPIDNGNYHVAYFEPPENKQDKVVKNYKFKSYDYRTAVWSAHIGDWEFPVLFGAYKTDYVETPDGLTINYWDGDANNPIKAGTVNFRISGTFVASDGTIKLNRL